VNPAQSREIFIQNALVEGQLREPPAVIRRNAEAVARVEQLEARIRRRNIRVTDQDIFAFYADRLPEDVYSARALKQWLHEDARAEQALALSDDALLLREPEEITKESYPGHLDYNGHRLELHYRFKRGEDDDGITCVVPLAALQSLPAHPFDWLVPGLLPEKIHALLKGLPKGLRRELVPLNRSVEQVLVEVTPGEAPLTAALGRWALRRHGLRIPADAWTSELPLYLTMRFKIVNEQGKVAGEGRDLDDLRGRIGRRIETSDRRKEPDRRWSRSGIREWDFGELAKSVDVGSQGWKVVQFPGVVDDGKSVSLRLFDSLHAAERASARGLARLTRLALPRDVKQLRNEVTLPALAALTLRWLGGDVPSVEDIVTRALVNACGFARELPRTHDAFVERIYAGKQHFYNETRRLSELLAGLLDTVGTLSARVDALNGEAYRSAADDLRAQLARLFHGRFVLDTPAVQLDQFPRYLKAIGIRLDRLKTALSKDGERLAQIAPYEERLATEADGDPEARETYRWMLEEWRVSLFAQALGTRVPVSAKRLDRQWAAALRAVGTGQSVEK
jgi:ATP-dependent helicase HrpA